MAGEHTGSSSPALASGRRIAVSPRLHGKVLGGRYAVEDVIGTGGMGTVYAAKDLLRGEAVAIKSLHARAFTSSNLQRLRRESIVTARCRSEHVCRVHHLGVERGIPFIVMERLVGDTVAARLRREGPLSAADAIAIMFQILQGLQAAHDAGVLHRDVKPSNVFIVTPPGQPPRVKLIDFGLSRPLPSTQLPVLGSDEDTSITSTDMIPGTPHYLTPEQLKGERDLDARVDVWAAALTMVEMLTGQRAYRMAKGSYELIESIIHGPVPSLGAQRSDVPTELDGVLARALEKDRQDRYPSAFAFRSALLDVWARHRANAIARGTLLRRAPGSSS